MTQDASNVLRGAMRLSPADRAELAAGLIESLDESTDANAAQTWDAEISRRITELDAGVVHTIPWDLVRRELMGS